MIVISASVVKDVKMATHMNDEIETLSFHIRRPVLLHGYIFPFILLYIAWFYHWVVVYGFWEYYEMFLIILAAIGCLQILVLLFCHWSVYVRCKLTSREVMLLDTQYTSYMLACTMHFLVSLAWVFLTREYETKARWS